MTLTVWDSWSALETATGGDVRRPMATRHPELIVAWDVAHYEAHRRVTEGQAGAG